MQENSKSLLTNKEKGEHLKEIFESLNKAKKRLDRLRSTRNLNNTEEAELQEVTIKLKSFYEKCKMFIKFRKNGPGKFMVDEYLKWCNAQKPYPNCGNSQYKSSLEYIKNENHIPARPYFGTEPQQINNQYPIPNRNMQQLEYGKIEDIYRTSYYRNQPPPERMGFSQPAPEYREYEYNVMDGPNYSRYPSVLDNERISSDSIRKSLGVIEPLQGPLASPRQIPQNAYPGPYFRSPPLSYFPNASGMGQMPMPVKTVAKRSNYSQPRPDQSSNLEPMPRPDFQDQRGQQFQMAPSERQSFYNKSPKHVISSVSPRTGYFERAPFQKPQNAEEHIGICPQIYSPNFGSANLDVCYPPKASPPFTPSMKFSSAPVISPNIKKDSALAKSYHKISELDPSIFEPLKDESPATSSEINTKYFSELRSRDPNTISSDSIQSQFPFEFRFDNKSSQFHNEDPLSILASAPGTEKLASIKGMPQLLFSKKGKGSFFKPSKKQNLELISTPRLDIDKFIKEIDPKISLDDKIKDCILIHIDSIMHKIMMFSANLAVDRKSRKFTIDDFKLAFNKVSNPSFFDAKNEDVPSNLADRDYAQHNSNIKLLEDLKWL